MKKFKKLLDNKQISFHTFNYQLLILFGLITTTCIYSDFYFQSSYLTIPFIITTLLSSIFTSLSIPILKKIKIKQIIRKEGPSKHFLKQGTPTMGGLILIPVGIIISNILYFEHQDSNIILILSLLIIFFMLIGFIDDLISLKKNFNMGLTSNQKLILQFFISIIFIYASKNYLSNTIQIANRIVNIGNLIYPLGIFVLLAESNSTNLTDGLDGLLSGCSTLIFTGLAITILMKSQDSPETLSTLCIVMAGSCMGFLFLNKYPAKLFMGDSGSLAIGACLAGIALISNNLWSLLIMGGILAAESISVIIQVCIFKISKKISGRGYKLFLMTPIHHHFELKGYKETQIVGSFWFITLILVIINIMFFIKP